MLYLYVYIKITIPDINFWLMRSALQAIFNYYKLLLVIKNLIKLDSFRNGLFNYYIVSTIKGFRSKEIYMPEL